MNFCCKGENFFLSVRASRSCTLRIVGLSQHAVSWKLQQFVCRYKKLLFCTLFAIRTWATAVRVLFFTLILENVVLFPDICASCALHAQQRSSELRDKKSKGFCWRSIRTKLSVNSSVWDVFTLSLRCERIFAEYVKRNVRVTQVHKFFCRCVNTPQLSVVVLSS